jgi:hypothetical protein
MSMKPLVDRLNREQAARKKRQEEAAKRMSAAKALAQQYVAPAFEGDYETFKVFAKNFLELVLVASQRQEYNNADTRWAIRQVLKAHEAGDSRPFAGYLDRYGPGKRWVTASDESFYGTQAVFVHFMQAWNERYNIECGFKVGSVYYDDEEFVSAIAKAVADFRAPIDADKLKAILGLLYG